MGKELLESVEMEGWSTIGQLIKILRGKENHEYTTFCMMLRQSNYELWVNELEPAAVRFQEGGGTAVAFL